MDSDTSNTFQMIQERLAEDTYCNTINRTVTITQSSYLSQLPSVKSFSVGPPSWFLSLRFSESLKDYKNTSKTVKTIIIFLRKYQNITLLPCFACPFI